MSSKTALYLKYRPTCWEEVVGQPVAVAKLQTLLKRKKLPNVILLYGNTGAGKTTIARILSKELGVDPVENNPNYTEQNCADCRGIDDVREISSVMGTAAWGGKARVWNLDEVVQLPKASQQAMLKMLEDTPRHCYFILCTTDKTDLLPTLVGRCFPVFLHPFKDPAMTDLLKSVTSKENIKTFQSVVKKIVAQADGSARMALQLLESVSTQSTEDLQLASIDGEAEETVAYQLAGALMYRKPWTVVAPMLSRLSQNPETCRRVILKYAETVLLGNAQINIKMLANLVIQKFRYSLGESGRPGLTGTCWEITHAKFAGN